MFRMNDIVDDRPAWKPKYADSSDDDENAASKFGKTTKTNGTVNPTLSQNKNGTNNNNLAASRRLGRDSDSESDDEDMRRRLAAKLTATVAKSMDSSSSAAVAKKAPTLRGAAAETKPAATGISSAAKKSLFESDSDDSSIEGGYSGTKQTYPTPKRKNPPPVDAKPDCDDASERATHCPNKREQDEMVSKNPPNAAKSAGPDGTDDSALVTVRL